MRIVFTVATISMLALITGNPAKAQGFVTLSNNQPTEKFSVARPGDNQINAMIPEPTTPDKRRMRLDRGRFDVGQYNDDMRSRSTRRRARVTQRHGNFVID
jgi:hypothetical protein